MPHASKMIRHINEFFKGKPTERRLQLLRDFADLMLLKLEADTTTRLLTAAGTLMLATVSVSRLSSIGFYGMTFINVPMS